jgi:nucleotide-binding universal stress UspA family protein
MRLLTLKSILVATDLGDASLPALRTAARLAQLAGAEIHLLHVAGDPGPNDETRLREQFQLTASTGLEPLTVEVLSGSPAVVIVEQAVRVGADAIIVGPHRRAGATAALGSTAASVVRTAPCPCLVVVTELRLPLERVIAPIDLSEVGGGALAVALSWASALRPRGGDVDLTALHVTRSPASTTAREVHEEVQRARSRAVRAARVEIRERVVPDLDPEEGILHAAVSESADLLVMGTRGEAGAPSGLGSVSAAVARATPCPLLLVPPVTWEEHRPVRT